MPEPSAEQAYLFRHALLRDAAYELQPPHERAKLHGLALTLVETACGGRPPMPPLDAPSATRHVAHPTDPFAAELAAHARAAMQQDDGGRFAEAFRIYLCRSAEVADEGYRHAESLAAWRLAASRFDGAGRCECLRRAANAATRLMKLDLAGQLYTESLELARQMRDPFAEGAALSGICVIGYQQAQFDRCARDGALALELLRNAPDRRMEVSALSTLASLHVARSEFEQGEALNLRALAIARETGFARAEATVVVNLGNLRSFQHRWADAECFDREGLALARAAGLRDVEAQALMNLADVFRHTARPDDAEHCMRAAIQLARDSGQPFVLAYSLSELGKLLLTLDRATEAEPLLIEAVAVGRETSGNIGYALDGCELALCLLSLGRRKQAQVTWAGNFAVVRARGRESSLDRLRRRMEDHCRRLGEPPLESP